MIVDIEILYFDEEKQKPMGRLVNRKISPDCKVIVDEDGEEIIIKTSNGEILCTFKKKNVYNYTIQNIE